MRKLLALLLVLALIAAACGDDDDTAAGDDGADTPSDDGTEEPADDGTEEPADDGSEEPMDDEPFVFGAAIAESGGFELYDSEVMKGMEYAIEQVNAAGGINGRMAELMIADHMTDVTQVEAVTESLIADGADLIVTTADYDFGAAAALAAANAGLISMGGAGAPEFGYEGLGDLHFNVYQGTPTEGAAAAEWGYNTKGWSNAFLLVDTSIEYSTSLCDFFEEVWTGLGGSIAGRETFLNSDASINSQVSSIAASDADVLIACSYPPGGASAIRQIRTGGIDLPIIGGAGYDGTFWLESTPDLSDFYYPTMVSSAGDDPNADVNTFLEFVDPAGGAIYALFGQQIVEIVARAAEMADSTDTEALASAIESFTDEPTLVGPTTFTDTCHIPLGRNMAIVEIQGGVPSFVEYVTPSLVPDSAC
ncbi:MAG: ABC transporter substrate-binding protein [Acidimicrobiales bacterium]